MSDTKCIRDKALNDLEAVQRLARVATDPDAYTAPEFDEAYARACAIQDEWAGGMVRLECDDVVVAFETAIEVRRVCRKYDLVPRAKLVEAEERFKQADHCVLKMTQDMAARLVEPKSNTHKIVLSAADVQTAIHPGIYCPSETDDFPAIADRINAIIKERMGAPDAPKHSVGWLFTKPAPLGPGDPLPPPPPPTKALEPWTVDRLKLVFDERDMLFDMEDDAAELVVELIKNNGGAANERVGTKAP